MTTKAPRQKAKHNHYPILTACAIFALLLAAALGVLIGMQIGEKPSAQASLETRESLPESVAQPTQPDFLRQQLAAAPLLRLVNRAHPLEEGYEPELTALRDWNLSVASEMYDDLHAMLSDGTAAGLEFEICSAYRSRQTQQSLYDAGIEKRIREGMSEDEAITDTEQYIQRPGCSEHETGLAVDIVAKSNQNLDSTQTETAESKWLQENCWNYGFILRYPPQKSEITGVAFEPWHYRYVGRQAAQYIREHDLTLEEFWEQAS